jgi:hypothetical protein
MPHLILAHSARDLAAAAHRIPGYASSAQPDAAAPYSGIRRFAFAMV